MSFERRQKMTTYFKLFYAALPLLTGLLLIKKTDDVGKAMLYSAFLGFVLYGVMFFIKALSSVGGSISPGLLWSIACNSTVQVMSEGFRLLKNIIFDKAAIATAVLVLFLMVKLISSSGALDYINKAAEGFVISRGRFLAVFLGLSLLFALDDYLFCVGIGAMMASGIAARQGISREKTAYMICLLAVAFCTVMPYSSWSPVIRSAIGTSVPVNSVLLMNVAGFFGIAIVMAEVLAGKAPSSTKKQKARELPAKAKRVFGVLIVSAAATAAALIAVNLVSDGSWSVAAAGTAGSFMLITLGIPLGMIRKDSICAGLRDAFKDTVSLFRTLFFVWMVKDICIELLGLSRLLMDVMQSAQIPPFLLPGIVYLVSSGFAVLTGTAFGTFSLFIPLAVDLLGSSGVSLKSVAAAAALAGSFQSINRPGADVIRLASGVLKCDGKKLMKLQRQECILGIPVLFVSFSIMGICADYGTAVMFSAAMVPVILFAVLCYLRQKGSVTGDMAVPAYCGCGGIPYKQKYFTFHQRCKDLEGPYTVILLGIRQKALALRPVNFI